MPERSATSTPPQCKGCCVLVVDLETKHLISLGASQKLGVAKLSGIYPEPSPPPGGEPFRKSQVGIHVAQPRELLAECQRAWTSGLRRPQGATLPALLIWPPP